MTSKSNSDELRAPIQGARCLTDFGHLGICEGDVEPGFIDLPRICQSRSLLLVPIIAEQITHVGDEGEGHREAQRAQGSVCYCSWENRNISATCLAPK